MGIILGLGVVDIAVEKRNVGRGFGGGFGRHK